MNILVLDEDPVQAARMHSDEDIEALLPEYAAILSAVHTIRGGNKLELAGRPAPLDHPCVLWVDDNAERYNWFYWLAQEAVEQYYLRLGKTNQAMDIVECLNHQPLSNGKTSPLKPFVQLVPECCKCPHDTVTAYRSAQRNHKRGSTWKYSESPSWWGSHDHGDPV